MVNFYTKTELEQTFGPLEATPGENIYYRQNINLEHALGPEYYIAGAHFTDKVKKFYYAVNILPADATTDEKTQSENAFKTIQDAVSYLETNGEWPTPNL